MAFLPKNYFIVRKYLQHSVFSEFITKHYSNTAAHINSESRTKKYDVVIVGGGIVGCASAKELKNRYPNLKVCVVEKESHLAAHQTGHNSGVIHAGIYYKPGSLKAKLCVEGMHLAYDYIEQNKIPHKKIGKLIVATKEAEVKALYNLFERGLANNVRDLKLIENVEEIKKIEPSCVGLKAIFSPHTGIVDWKMVTEYYAKEIEASGGDIYFNFEVNDFIESDDQEYPVSVKSKKEECISTKYVLTCAGLYSDYLAQISGCSPEPKIVPFRGEYLILNPKKSHLVKTNIYPVPDPNLPFLGVHFTPRMDGAIWLGPNAILAFKREGYRWTDFNLNEFLDALKFKGFRKIALKHTVFGITEIIKSFVPSLVAKDLQKYIPEISSKDILRNVKNPSGVRAQAMDSEGNLVDDFVFDMGKGSIGKRILHCRNAPSPGATSSLAIAKMMIDKVEKEFELR